MKKIILDEAEVLRLYKEGLTSEEIGKKMGCSKIPVLRILKANNISNAARKEAADKAREAQRLSKINYCSISRNYRRIQALFI